MPLAPLETYAARLDACEAKLKQLDKVFERIGYLRLLLAAIVLVVGWFAVFRGAFSPGWLIVPVGAFVALVAYHRSVRRAKNREARAADYYRRGITRIEDRWIGSGQTGERFDDPHHIYASDLDLFGKGSLFELLSTARTRMGEETLARWLLEPAPADRIRERHACIADLRDRLDLREDIAVLGEESAVGVRPDSLLAWAESPNVLEQRWLRVVTVVLPALAIATLIVWIATGIGAPFLLVLLIEGGILYALRSKIRKVLHDTENAFDDLKLFASLLVRLERETFSAPPLQALIARLSSHALPASQAMAKLSTVANLAESRRNQIVGVLELPLMYSAQVALAAERWRRNHGSVVRTWVDSAGEIEALLSLATYSYEHPDDPFPEIIDGPAFFEGTQLGHPLLPAAHCVRNDVVIGGATKILLVSGSNMSGKSTLLRTVGINTVLAMAGAPVRAQRLRLTPLQIGASIRINDSLHEGSSRFYAEITRLRQFFDYTTRELPLLFLLDELLQGTNSRDRRIGAEGIVRAFVERGAIGLISTHDLALTEISGLEPGTLRNVHFQDELENGRMKFDYKLRDGVVTKSNGIELMRSIGLEV